MKATEDPLVIAILTRARLGGWTYQNLLEELCTALQANRARMLGELLEIYEKGIPPTIIVVTDEQAKRLGSGGRLVD